MLATNPIQGQDVTITQDGRYYFERTAQTFAVNPGGTLTIDSPSGSIRIESGTNNEVVVVAEKRISENDEADAREEFSDIEVSMDQRGDDVRIQVDGLGRRSYRSMQIRFTVKVPTPYNLNLDTKGGSIRIGDLQGDVVAETSGGGIEVGRITGGRVDVTTAGGSITIREGGEDVQATTAGGSISVRRTGGDLSVRTAGGSLDIGPVGGNIRANTAGGSIHLEESGGSVWAKTAGGSIHVDGSNGPVEVETAGGSIEIENARGAIEARTAGGDVEAELVIFDAGVDTHCYLKTAGGDVTIYLPENLAASIDAEIRIRGNDRWRDDDYRIYSDFDLDMEDDVDKYRNRITAQGDINGGGDRIRLNTTNGDIYIRKLNR
jgi:DUF4097 and DUF4098 domain-containing protein YvlB